MVLRRRPKQSEPVLARPAWQDRFDAAASLIRSRPQPEWIDDRLTQVEAALAAAEADLEDLSRSIERLDPVATASRLKDELRAAERRLAPQPGGDRNRRIATLRRRYEAVNEMLNQRHEVAERLDDSIADLELLAVETMHSELSERSMHGLDEHLLGLQDALNALKSAQEEVREW